jgi:hypothetical protein
MEIFSRNTDICFEFMMLLVHVLVNETMMQRPVCPIERSILHENAHEKLASKHM